MSKKAISAKTINILMSVIVKHIKSENVDDKQLKSIFYIIGKAKNKKCVYLNQNEIDTIYNFLIGIAKTQDFNIQLFDLICDISSKLVITDEFGYYFKFSHFNKIKNIKALREIARQTALNNEIAIENEMKFSALDGTLKESKRLIDKDTIFGPVSADAFTFIRKVAAKNGSAVSKIKI